jgi:hypothetical protein
MTYYLGNHTEQKPPPKQDEQANPVNPDSPSSGKVPQQGNEKAPKKQ